MAGALALAFLGWLSGQAFLAAFRGTVPLLSEGQVYHGLGGGTKRLRARSAVALSRLRRAVQITSEGALDPDARATPNRRISGAFSGASTEPGRCTTAMGMLRAMSLPAPPAAELFQIVAAHQPDEVHVRESGARSALIVSMV